MRITFDWVAIPSGPFRMGTDLTQDPIAAHSDWAGKTELPQHEVELAEYRITRTLVTNEQWGCFLSETGYPWADRDKLWQDGLPPAKRTHPVVWVTWFDAMAFCTWAGVDLPSEAEWEKAARGTDARLYPWGNHAPSLALANFGLLVGDTTPVDRYPLGCSYYGLHDMAGNVWEWTGTVWGVEKNSPEFIYPYRADDGREDRLRKDVLRVVRSAGWKYSPELIRAAARDWNLPTVRGSGLGFRVVTRK
ncbi:MAG: SUMF1/EgtB/PvdO family nonheme iron enzyme [Sulfuricellaceae bacterium]